MYRGRFPYSMPKNRLQGFAALPPLLALVFGCGARELLTTMERSSMTVLTGMVVGGIVGMVAGLIVLWMVVNSRQEPPETVLDPSEEGTATDPDL